MTEPEEFPAISKDVQTSNQLRLSKLDIASSCDSPKSKEAFLSIQTASESAEKGIIM
jgi:hypothetical protein